MQVLRLQVPAFCFFEEEYMEEKLLHIGNMVCPRCIMVVQDILKKNGAQVLEIELGNTRIATPDDFSLAAVQADLQAVGFELLRSPEQQLTEQIRLKVLEYLTLSEEQKMPSTLSGYLADSLNRNYSALSRHFTRHSGHTIESLYIQGRIERVKALLQENKLNVSQIADKLGYSSVHYLSGQFKKVTGLSISEYKSQSETGRTSLDKI